MKKKKKNRPTFHEAHHNVYSALELTLFYLKRY